MNHFKKNKIKKKRLLIYAWQMLDAVCVYSNCLNGQMKFPQVNSNLYLVRCIRVYLYINVTIVMCILWVNENLTLRLSNAS